MILGVWFLGSARGWSGWRSALLAWLAGFSGVAWRTKACTARGNQAWPELCEAVLHLAKDPLGILAAGLVLQLTGCGKTIKPEGAAKSVTDLVSKQTDFKPTDVKCPSGVDAKVGKEFDCHFTGPDGPYTAHLKVQKVNGDDVEFYITTRRS